jgi:RNA polymerase sigma-70 factor (ECF subfamily)
MTSDKSDYDLIKEFIDGSDSAFNALARRYQEKIYWHARRMTGNHLDADEIVQQVLLVMFNKLKTFKFQSSLYTWIFRITSTRSLNLIKKRQIQRWIPLDQVSKTGEAKNDIFTKLEEKEKFEQMQKYLAEIPAKQREVFLLRNFEGLSYEEIAKITGRSVGTLKANYHHAFKKIKKLMQHYEK